MSNSNKHWELNPELKELAEEGGGPAVAQILKGFLEEAQDQLPRAEDAQLSEDIETLKFAANVLSGSAAAGELNKASQVARQLQLLANAHKISESHEQLEDLKTKSRPARLALNETISELEPADPRFQS
jgi:HPt (histidine-containing phosphotransfer) domain-containing protein